MTISVSKDKLINEICLLPEENLGEVYDLIHNFRLGEEKAKQKKSNILSFSGAWKDMDDEIFNDYLSDILKRRSRAFSSRGR